MVRTISEFAVDSVMADDVGISRAPFPDRNGRIGSVLTQLRKFAVDGAVNLSLKGITGGKRVYKIVQERFTDRTPPSLNDKKKPEDCGQVDKMQVKMKEFEENTNDIKPHSQTSVTTMGASEPLKKTPNEGIKELDFENNNQKRIFIRSRL